MERKSGNGGQGSWKEPIKRHADSEGAGLDVHFARDYLESTAEVGYYEGINLGTPESLMVTKAKLGQLANFLEKPRDIVSVGVGSGEEVQAAVELFAPRGARVHGLDLSPRAISFAKDRLDRYGLKAHLVEASALDMPFADNSIDGFIMSAILHEIYSYVPDGKEAWGQAIREVSTKLAENGAFLLRDFAAPQVKEPVDLKMGSEVAGRFYQYFREQYRVFASWDEKDVATIVDKRIPNAPDFPAIDEQSRTVRLPYAKAAEVLLHFRNFYNDYSRGLTTFGDPHWKEINESYLPPSPRAHPSEAMPKYEYIGAVLSEADTALAGTPYKFLCVQDAISGRPETNGFLKDHFSLRLPGSGAISEDLIGGVTNKMELVFKKVRRQTSQLT